MTTTTPSPSSATNPSPTPLPLFPFPSDVSIVNASIKRLRADLLFAHAGFGKHAKVFYPTLFRLNPKPYGALGPRWIPVMSTAKIPKRWGIGPTYRVTGYGFGPLYLRSEINCGTPEECEAVILALGPTLYPEIKIEE